ncbi:MAG: hypothetical protein M3N68_09105 [Actinomycetota bacterium]|nr:hypothetical protein [Actinomycetota bacterium]
MEEQAKALADGIEAALPAWVERSVEAVLVAWRGAADPTVLGAAREAGVRARSDVGGRVRALLEGDVDEQRSTPLSILRDAVRYPTEVLRAAGVPPVERDDFATACFPSDDYGLTPASLADLDPALVEAGIAWGAAKAWTHKQRHGAGTGPALPPENRSQP